MFCQVHLSIFFFSFPFFLWIWTGIHTTITCQRLVYTWTSALGRGDSRFGCVGFGANQINSFTKKRSKPIFNKEQNQWIEFYLVRFIIGMVLDSWYFLSFLSNFYFYFHVCFELVIFANVKLKLDLFLFLWNKIWYFCWFITLF